MKRTELAPTAARLAGLLVFLLVVPACASQANGDDEAFQHPSREPRGFGTAGASLTYVVLGDSTAAGQGGDYEEGIAVLTSRELARNRRVSMTNLAVSGATLQDVVSSQLARAEAIRPELVLISAGANDITHLTSVSSAEQNLLTIVRRLKAAQPAVKIVVTGAPQMGSAPRIPALLRPLARRRTDALNRGVRKIAGNERLVFAPIADETGPLFYRDRSLFASDRFHPNNRGYATWVPVLNRAIAEALSR